MRVLWGGVAGQMMSSVKFFFLVLAGSFAFAVAEKGSGSMSPEWGGGGGEQFSDGRSRGIRHIDIKHGSKIDMIRMTYDQDGVPTNGGQHGGIGGTGVEISLDFPDEILYQVSGTYDRTVNSLILYTKRKNGDRKQYGPFGKVSGNYFKSAQGKVVGMFGRAGIYVNAIGVYFDEPCWNRTQI